MKIFLTHTFKGADNKTEIEHLCNIVEKAGFTAYSFVRDAENYSPKAFSSKTALMAAARDAIHSCDALLIDMTDPSIGKGIEAGIAYERQMPIIALKHLTAENRSTVIGIADIVIEYDHIDDIVLPLKEFFSKITNSI